MAKDRAAPRVGTTPRKRTIDFSNVADSPVKRGRPQVIAEEITGETMSAEDLRAANQQWYQQTAEAVIGRFNGAFLAEIEKIQARKQAQAWVDAQQAVSVADDFHATDLSGLLTGELPKDPPPDVLMFDQGLGLFNRGYTNQVFGEKASGKTWIALAACVEIMRAGGTAWFVDMDHNGAARIAEHLVFLGARVEDIANPAKFRLYEPKTREEVNAIREAAVTTPPDIVVLDSIGELLPMYEARTNDADDYTRVHASVMKPMAVAGACVLCIDHPSKSFESRLSPTGTMAKGRAVRGTSILVEVVQAFKKGRGGQAKLTMDKDAGGDLFALTGDDNVLGSFVLEPDGGWSFGDPLSLPTRQEKARDRTKARRAGLWEWIYDHLADKPVTGADLIRIAQQEFPDKRPTGWGANNIRDMLKLKIEAKELTIKDGKYHVGD